MTRHERPGTRVLEAWFDSPAHIHGVPAPCVKTTPRRARALEAIGEGAVAILQGGPKGYSHDKFRQDNDFYYLSGVETPHAYLVLDGRNGRSILFLPYQSRTRIENEGALLSANDPDAAAEVSGFDEIAGLDDIAAVLQRATVVYTPMRQGEGPAISWDTLQRGRQERFADPWDGEAVRCEGSSRSCETAAPAPSCAISRRSSTICES